MLVCAFSWEQRKFSELTEIRSASRVHKDEWQSSGVPFYRSSDVMAALNGTENEKAFISEELYEKLSAVSGKLEKGDVLVTGGGSVGKPYIVPNNEPLYTKDADLLWIKNNENLDPYFVYTFFFSPTFTDYLNSVSHVGTIAHYTITQLGETPITLPCVSEQQKIGDYFRNLDFLITLHQRECFSFDFGSRSAKVAQKTISWEQRKLSDMVERVTRKNENLESELPLTISAQYGLIDQNEFFDKRIASRDVSGYYLLKKGEFAYNKSTSSDAPWGAVKRLDRYEMGVLSTLYIVFALKEDGNIDSDFLVSYYDTDCWHKGVQAIAAEGARNHGLLNITPADYFETVLTVPSDVKEQHQIGTFFAKLDTLITLHQRKCDALQKFKKSMLQKMFPQNGESVPEIRFAGFTDAWEQRKFSELTEIRSASRVHKDEWQSSGVPFYRSSDVMAALNGTENEKAFISEELYEKLSAVSGKLEKGDVLVTGGGSVGKPYIVPNNEPLYTKDADLLWIKNNENLDPYFVYTFFFSPTFTDYLNSVSHVGTIAHYTITQLGETPITLPCVSEQQKIGDYFRNLDFLITLHQRKLETLQKMKKSLLQKMFV